MGSEKYFKKSRGERLGKIDSPLGKKLQTVKWGEYKLGDLFEVLSYKERFDANKVTLVKTGGHPYIVRQGSDNGQKGFIDEDEVYLNDGNTISFGQDTATMFYQEQPYFTGDKIKILKPKLARFGKNNAQFFLATMRLSFSSFAWGNSSFSIKIIQNQKIHLPVTANDDIDFDFMESYIRELEVERVRNLQSYLSATGMSDYKLTEREEAALNAFDRLEWQEFNVKSLFGKSKRGKRLKGDDRIAGDLPFVTAGETNTGISAFISNDVEIFSANTTTIDMFGSAKYRNYNYGADDHVAVVHTEQLNKYAAIFVTTSCHKSAHNGQFNYGHNFYAKDADELNIMLPVCNGAPNYSVMQDVISAMHKMVIKDVVRYTEAKI